ncbi:MAG: hypothetical protein AB8B60_18260 [Sulfitobacter sp.]
MIAFLEELMAKLFGARDELPVRMRADDDERRVSDVMKGRK